jgi:hypothetical protein
MKAEKIVMDPDATDGFPELISRFADSARQLLYRYHHELTDKFGPIDGELAWNDVFMAGALRRSYALTRGFCDLIASRNFTAAAPLIRLQLDNSLRIAASAWARDPKDFFTGIAEGKQINKMRSDDDKTMTDRYLCDRLAPYHPWISQLYKETSSFVHLSDKHMLAALAPHPGYEAFHCMLNDDEPGVPDGAYGDALISFIRATLLFLELVEIYAEQKYNAKSGA